MDNAKRAVEVFREGFSCSQAVLEAFCEDLGMDRDTALKISQSFGGGGANTSLLPLDWSGPTTPLCSICSIIRAARL